MRLISLCVLLCLLLAATFQVARAPRAYALQDRDTLSAVPSALHPAGTDELGRDRAGRIALATLLSVGGAFCASACAAFLALGFASLAAVSGRWISRLVLYGADLFLTLPWLFLLMTVRSVLPLTTSPLQSAVITFSLLGVLGAPVFLRTNLNRLIGLLRSDWLCHARASGNRPLHLGKHLWPHLRPLLVTQFLLYVPACVLAEANLGSMGLGLAEPLPSFGTFLASLQAEVLFSSSRLVFLPLVVLVFALVSLEMVVFGAETR